MVSGKTRVSEWRSSRFRAFHLYNETNLGQSWKIFRCFESLQIAQSLQKSLETVAHYLEAILKVSGQTRVSEWRSSGFHDFRLYNSSTFGSIMWDFFDVWGNLQLTESLEISLEAATNYLEAILKVSDHSRGADWSSSRFRDFGLYNSSEFESIMGDFRCFGEPTARRDTENMSRCCIKLLRSYTEGFR